MVLKIFNFILNKIKKTEDCLFLLHEFGFIDENLEPLKCYHCGSKKYNDVVVDTIDYHPCEIKRVCVECKKDIGYWAYGSWSP